MASITLAETKKLGLDDLGAGVAEEIITVNPIYQALPWNSVNGNAYVFNRENTLADVQVLGIDGTITAKAAGTVTQIALPLSTIIGDAEINQLLVAQGVGANVGQNPVAAQIASKAKALGREWQRQMVLGDTANANEFDGLVKLVNSAPFSAQLLDATGSAFDLAIVDELLDAITSKGTQVDGLMCNAAVQRAIRAKLNALGGNNAEYIMFGQTRVLAYNGVPIFRNDYITGDVDGVLAGKQSYIFGFNFDDGSRTQGIAGVMPSQMSGIQVENVGPAELKDNHIYRVKMYSTFACHSTKSLAAAKVTY